MREFIEIMESVKGIDSLTIDVPLFIRLLEFAREDASTDMDLHKVTERMLEIQQSTPVLGMDQYVDIVGK